MTKPQRCALLVESRRRERGEGAAGGREIKLHRLYRWNDGKSTHRGHMEIKGEKNPAKLDYIYIYNTQAWEHNPPTNNQKNCKAAPQREKALIKER